MHFNTRFLKTSQEWFGGGMDITPSLKFSEEDKYHSGLEKICNRYDKSYYPKYKKWCDDYFFLKHRNEARGVGGIFFDYLQTGDWGKDFEFVQDVGLYFQNFGGSESSIGVGRYTGLLGQGGHQNQMGVRENQGFRCVVKFDEQIY